MAQDHSPEFDDSVLYQWGSEELVIAHQQKFVRYFIGAPGKVLEIGCGRGTMLGLLGRAGVESYGLDLSPSAVEACRAKGYEATHGEALSHLRAAAPGSLGGIFCAHVVEHLPPTDAMTLIAQAYRVLNGGGRIVFVTPNAKDLRTTERFWLDPTHVRPYPRKLLEFMLRQQGFGPVRSSTDSEPVGNPLEWLAKKFLHVWFMGYLFTGDLIVVAEKKR